MRYTMLALLAVGVCLLGFIAYRLSQPSRVDVLLEAAGVPESVDAYDRRRRSLARARVRSELLNIATLQELHFSDAGTYARAFPAHEVFRSGSVHLTITEADRDGWAAVAWSRTVAGVRCTIYDGEVATMPLLADGSRPQDPGVVACH